MSEGDDRDVGGDVRDEPLDRSSLDINTLARFSKSSRLVLEQYGSCALPAGCGGIIIRWADPNGPVTLQSALSCAGVCERVFVDGRPQHASRLVLRPGAHVVVFELVYARGVPVDEACMAVLSTSLTEITRLREDAFALTLATGAEGTWRYTLEPPGELELTALVCDPVFWKVPARVELSRQPAEGEAAMWRMCQDAGAAAITFPAGATRLWLRVGVAIPTRQQG